MQQKQGFSRQIGCLEWWCFSWSGASGNLDQDGRVYQSMVLARPMSFRCNISTLFWSISYVDLENLSQILTQIQTQYSRVNGLLSILSDSHSLNISVTSKRWHLYSRLFCFLSTFSYSNVQQIHSVLHTFAQNLAGKDQPVNLVSGGAWPKNFLDDLAIWHKAQLDHVVKTVLHLPRSILII